MKKIVMAAVLTASLLTTSQAYSAANDIDLSLLTGLQTEIQSDFKDISNELGLAIAYKPTSPAEAGGITGFDIGVEFSFADIDEKKRYWQLVSGGTDAPKMLPVPKIHIQKGLPFGIDLAATYTQIPDSSINVTGVALKYAILEGGVASPAIAIRGSYTTLNGIDNLTFNTTGLDVSISKGFLFLTPYAGAGMVNINSDYSKTIGGFNISSESLTESKTFAGLQLSMALLKITAEYESATIPSYSLKLSLGF